MSDEDMAILLAEAITKADPGLSERLDSDPQAYLEMVKLSNVADIESGKLLHSAVLSARAAGFSWEAIGNTLDMSRQAAHQRFGLNCQSLEESGERHRHVGLMVINEIDELNKWGRYGWHLVGYGPLFHDIEKSAWQWEHCRVVVASKSVHNLEESGWQRVGTLWFPWHYFKRPIDEPAWQEESE